MVRAWGAVGRRRAPWQDVGTVLGLFGGRREAAVEAYRRFVAEGAGLPPPVDGMSREAIVRHGGEWEVLGVEGPGKRAGEESIAGGKEFVERALAREQDQEARRSRLRREGWTPARVVARGRTLAAKLGRRLEDADDAGAPRGFTGGRQS